MRLPAFPGDNIKKAPESIKFWLVESGILRFGIKYQILYLTKTFENRSKFK